MSLNPETVAFGVLCLLLGSGATLLIRLDRAERTKRKRVADRRARRLEASTSVIDEDTFEFPVLVPTFVGRERSAYRPDALDPAVAMRRDRAILSGERMEIWDDAAELGDASDWAAHIDAVYGRTESEVEHHASDAMDAGLSQLLDEGCWDKALARMTALNEETGTHPIVATHPTPTTDTDVPSGPPPKLVGQPRVAAEVIKRIHAASVR